jgi:hypothetical protein
MSDESSAARALADARKDLANAINQTENEFLCPLGAGHGWGAWTDAEHDLAASQVRRFAARMRAAIGIASDSERVSEASATPGGSHD